MQSASILGAITLVGISALISLPIAIIIARQLGGNGASALTAGDNGDPVQIEGTGKLGGASGTAVVKGVPAIFLCVFAVVMTAMIVSIWLLSK